MQTKAQSATEILIIVAVTLIFVSVVIAFLGGYTSYGGDKVKITNDVNLQAADVGIYKYIMTSSNTTLYLKNNNKVIIEIDAILVDETLCDGVTDVILDVNEEGTIVCTNVFTEDGFAFLPITLNYTDLTTNASYAVFRHDYHLMESSE